MSLLFSLLVLLFSVVIHEVSHGYAAKAQGDNTAEYMGRLTLNPIPHLDPIGSILLPFTMYILSRLSGGPIFLFGWARPVPYNPFNLRNQKWGPVLVALAGPAANFSIALLFGIAVRLFAKSGFLGAPLEFFGAVIYLNLLLGFFNLVPLPPLDGSKLLFALLHEEHRAVMEFLERYGMLLIIMFLFLGFPILQSLIAAVFRLLTGGAIGI